MKRETDLEILRLIHQDYSFWAIKKYFKDQNVTIHDCQIVRIKEKVLDQQGKSATSASTTQEEGSTNHVISIESFKPEKSVFVENPKPNYELAKKYDVHKSTIGRYIKSSSW